MGQKNTFFKKRTEEVIESKGSARKTNLNEPENEAGKLLKIRSCGKNEPENEPSHFIENKGCRKNKPKTKPGLYSHCLAFFTANLPPVVDAASSIALQPSCHAAESGPPCKVSSGEFISPYGGVKPPLRVQTGGTTGMIAKPARLR